MYLTIVNLTIKVVCVFLGDWKGERGLQLVISWVSINSDECNQEQLHECNQEQPRVGNGGLDPIPKYIF